MKAIKIPLKWSFLFSMLVFLLWNSHPAQAQDKTAAGLYNKGLALLKAKNYEDALPVLEAAVQLADKDQNAKVSNLARKNGALAAYKVGTTKRKAKEYDAANEFFEKGISLNENYYVNYVGKAQVLDAQGKKVEAVKGYLEAASIAEKGKRPEKAATYSKKAENMVGVAYSKKNWKATLEMGNAFLEKRESADVHYYLAGALKATGKSSTALEHANQAIKLSEASEADKAKYYMAKAEILEKMKRTNEAVATYKKVAGDKYKQQAAYKVKTLSGSK